ncbi:MAG TPA: hypothetical protein VN947_15075 [Polyangia bacterium]|nr:hypothetical protein [Polyangia bacterium]
MARALGVGVPAGGLTAGVAALVLWVSALPLRWLDGLVAGLFACGLVLAVAGFARGADTRTRRLGVLALGWNAFGLLILAAVYLIR